MTIIRSDFAHHLAEYRSAPTTSPAFYLGDTLAILRGLPDSVFDCAITSPPYWNKRTYSNGGIGNESSHADYMASILAICAEVKRVLKPSGSFWLNIGDSYIKKSLAGIPWRIALQMTDTQGWTLRNSIIWHKVKGGPDNSKDKLRNVHEHVFHFTKSSNGYYYDIDSVRSKPNTARVENGAVVSATGVKGVRYKRQIELSTELTPAEKEAAFLALENILDQIRKGELFDFRMVIRGRQRTTHSDSEAVSGRAKELRDRGFYFLKYHPKGAKPGDVWDILPEDTQKREGHFAPYPEDLCVIPIKTTCPPGGLVLDPFCGTGTTNLVASRLGRKSVGIDLAEDYLTHAADRCRCLL